MTTQITTTQPEPKWSDLPKEILRRIARYLDWRTELPKVRAVCPSWRSNLPNNPHIFSNTIHKIDSFTLFPSHFYLVTPLSQPKSKSKSPWLIRANQTSPNTNTYSLQNPLNQTQYISRDSPVRTSLSLLNTHFLELSTTYTLIREEFKPPILCAKKVVGGWALDSPFRFSILAQMVPKHGDQIMLFWKYGDKSFTLVKGANSNTPLKIVDSAFFNKKFYSFDIKKWEIGVLDPLNVNEWAEMEFHPAPDIYLCNDSNGQYIVTFKNSPLYLRDVYLVPTSVGLYLIFEVVDDVGEGDGTQQHVKGRMIVYKMRESGVEGVKQKQKPTWENVETLDDQVFFIGYDTSFAVPQVNLPQWKPNSICLLTHPGLLSLEFPVRVGSLEKMSFEDFGKCLGVFVLGEEEKGVVLFKELPEEVYTGLFFLPPPWVKWVYPGFDDLEVNFDKIMLGKDPRFGEMAFSAVVDE